MTGEVISLASLSRALDRLQPSTKSQQTDCLNQSFGGHLRVVELYPRFGAIEAHRDSLHARQPLQGCCD